MKKRSSSARSATQRTKQHHSAQVEPPFAQAAHTSNSHSKAKEDVATSQSVWRKIWQKYWLWIVFGAILFFALVLRFYRLADVPHGMTWDEAAIGYNGWAIWKARRDEWLVRLPVSFKSFGDYKAPLAIYLTAIVSGVLGLSLWTLRLPFAVAGVLAVGGVILWLRWWLSEWLEETTAKHLALLAGVLLMVSPWHLHFSRAGFESGLALSWVIAGMICFTCSLKAQTWLSQKRLKNWQALFWQSMMMTASSICFIASVYTYHSAKVFVPVLGVLLLVSFSKRLWQQKASVVVAAVIGAVSAWPLLKDTLWANGGERFTQASIFSSGSTPLQILTTFIQHLMAHFTPGFLWLGQTTTLRHGDGHWGVLYLSSVLVILGGLVLVVLNKNLRHNIRKVWAFGVAWVVAGILPAAIGVDVPHSNRALLALPGFIILTVVSLQMIADWLDQLPQNAQVQGSHGEQHLLRKSFIGVFLLLESLFFVAYTHDYYTTFAAASASEWQDGYLAAMKLAASKEAQVDKILFTSHYQQPYIYALFVRKTNPIWYQGGSLIKYEFTDKISSGDLERHNTLIIADPQQLDPKLGQEVIYGSDGQPRFVVVQTK